MIELEHVAYRYPKGGRQVFTDLNAVFPDGVITAVTGPNGCGKTTLTRLMVGILRPDRGSVRIDGADTAGMDLYQIGQKVGYLFQNPSRQLFCDTVWNEVTFGLDRLGLSAEQAARRAEEQLDFFHIGHLRARWPGSLSQGEKQRVALCTVLVRGVDFLVLDEPTTGLDMKGRRELGELLARLGCGVVLVSHERAFVERYAGREWRLA